MIDYVTLLLINMVSALVVLAFFLWWGLGRGLHLGLHRRRGLLESHEGETAVADHHGFDQALDHPYPETVIRLKPAPKDVSTMPRRQNE